jgi:NAD(P)H-hydrate epimerase
MRQWENATWAAGKTEGQVIQAVGEAVARRIRELTGQQDRILCLAGKGHNGDDARAASADLRRDRSVVSIDVREPEEGLAGLGYPKPARTRGFTWVIDGLFGVGLNRPLDEHWRALINAVNIWNVPVLSIDVPSGLNAETGEPEGAAIQAEITLTVGAPKLGLLKAPQFVGRLEVMASVGLVDCPFASELNWILPGDFQGLPPRRPVAGHKGSFGHLAIVAGSQGYHGAAVLAARGAGRAQPGLVTVYAQESVYVPVAAQLQSTMVRPWRAEESLSRTCTGILFGPGLGREDLPDSLKRELRSLWKNWPAPMVVDASALDWLEPGATPDGAPRVITPHPGEAGRLLASSAAGVQADRVGALRGLSERFGNCIVVLKGSQTLVGQASGEISINSSGNPMLAQGGSGDLLGGYLAGLLAQAQWQRQPLTAARYAVWQHGAAADRLSATQPNWTVEDLAAAVGSVRPGMD